jgi:hypothetical protein
MDALQGRAEEELGHADFGHSARTTRGVAIWERLAAEPKGTVAEAFPVAAERKGAYRFLESSHVLWEPLAEAVHQATARRCRDHAMVLVAIDGSSFAHTDTHGDDGVGPIGSRTAGGRGIKSMIALAMSYDGVPLGIGAHVLWARPEVANPTPHTHRTLDAKESRWWTELQTQFEASLKSEGATTTPWYQMDREADTSHVLMRGIQPGTVVTVRSNHNRLLTAKTGRRTHRKLHAALAAAPALGVVYLHVPRGKKREDRLARLEVRVVPVELELRALWSRRWLANVPITAVEVREVGTCPNGEDPLTWLLLTTYPTTTLDDAVQVVRAYALRWVVERLHYTWKTGTCRIEQSQLESFEALRKWATLHLSVAAHRQHVLHLSRTQPELPATEVFERTEIDAALTLYTQHRLDAPRPGTTPTLGTLVDIIARLGGYAGKTSGGPAGIKLFARGMERVEIAALALRLQRQLEQAPTSTEGSG